MPGDEELGFEAAVAALGTCLEHVHEQSLVQAWRSCDGKVKMTCGNQLVIAYYTVSNLERYSAVKSSFCFLKYPGLVPSTHKMANYI